MTGRAPILLLVALLALPLAGCGEKPEENPNVVASDPKASLMSKPKGMAGGGEGAPAPAAATPKTE